jgi:hypothetical protein
MPLNLLSWLRKNPQRERVISASVQKLRFLGEQDGSVERDVKERWVAILRASPPIRRAFLVRALYEGQPDPQVILALCSSSGPDAALVAALRVPFADIFHRDCPLDMAFVTPAQESQIEPVCRPFYTAV